MYSAFKAAAMLDSATFAAFDLLVKGDEASLASHIGTCRKYNNSVQLGYTYGSALGDLVIPYRRDKHEVCWYTLLFTFNRFAIGFRY